MNKNIIAREWLLLIVAVTVGIVVCPFIFFDYQESYYSYAINRMIYGRYDEVLKYLTSGKRTFLTIFMILFPYLAIQLFRSILWAGKLLSKKPN